ncbi:hypothetical protein NVP1021C_39 [Vibrio phage 1.021.C._10N.222.51.F9]|nr:hypothetical protein NVP1021A_39 [Vibrio phage 1.021.A._10N.222.51.F9]AUR82152.1 hypothetical protein NVP1021B_39 [Vibrio phage 1.021.B._10N.222.51.F9]AUR82202.1 hypothetical protein NVP1021C_39 [Vibrio phage 1.021.C._10N.222.51.F9]
MLKKSQPQLTQSQLKQLLHYNPETGVFTWLPRPETMFASKAAYKCWNAKYPHKKAGSIDTTNRVNYIRIVIHNKTYAAHKLAFLYMENRIPDVKVTHVDLDTLNNSWGNLKESTDLEVQSNRKLTSGSKSGVLGVKIKKNGKYEVCIRKNSKYMYIGCFSDFFEAVCARKSAEKKHQFHTSHGRV